MFNFNRRGIGMFFFLVPMIMIAYASYHKYDKYTAMLITSVYFMWWITLKVVGMFLNK